MATIPVRTDVKRVTTPRAAPVIPARTDVKRTATPRVAPVTPVRTDANTGRQRVLPGRAGQVANKGSAISAAAKNFLGGGKGSFISGLASNFPKKTGGPGRTMTGRPTIPANARSGLNTGLPAGGPAGVPRGTLPTRGRIR